MMPAKILNRSFRILGVLLLAASLTGCMYWLRAYQTYLQMSEFDRYFKIAVANDFTLKFNEPKMFSDDFVDLAKLYPSEDTATQDGRHWRYWFRKADKDNQLVKPDIKFYSDMTFDKEKKITSWSFSPLFLEIAPPEFLEISLRSIAGGEIDKENQSLKANTDLVGKINAKLPKKAAVLAKLGEPISIQDEPELEVYLYRFLLQTPRIEKGYEKNAVNEVKLSFDKKNQDLVIMAGNFAGLKLAIDYRKFLSAAK